MEAFIALLYRAFGSEWFSSRDVLRSMNLRDAASRAAGKPIKFRITLAELMETATGIYTVNGKRLRIETGRLRWAMKWRVVEVDSGREGSDRFQDEVAYEFGLRNAGRVKND